MGAYTKLILNNLAYITFTGGIGSTPCSVRLTCSLCSTRQSMPNITAVCSHSSFQSGSGIWTVADHSIGEGENGADSCIHTCKRGHVTSLCYCPYLYKQEQFHSTDLLDYYYHQYKSSQCLPLSAHTQSHTDM